VAPSGLPALLDLALASTPKTRAATDGPEYPRPDPTNATENPTWGAPRIHGELRLLGITVSERTVSRYMPRRPPQPDAAQRWRTFLRNHRDAIAAMDFFVVPTVTLRLVYVWFVIGHDRRRLLHFDVTANPAAAWVIQQLREAFPFGTAPRHVIFDRDSIFSAPVVSTMRSFGIQPARTAWKSPWQNAVAERWIGSVRRGAAVAAHAGWGVLGPTG